MGRHSPDTNSLYRVVVVGHDGSVDYRGPYPNRATAVGQATFQKNRKAWRSEGGTTYADAWAEEITGEWVKV